jgi:hypothetical protein
MATKTAQTTSNQRDIFLAFIAFLIALALWQVEGLYLITQPFRLFVTMIHELGHGAAAILTGGSFLRFQITEQGAGVAYTAGGSSFFRIQAGYLGTAIFGAVLLYLANRARRPGVVAIVLGLLIGILTLLYSGISLSNLSVIETTLVAALIIIALYLFLTRQTDRGRLAGLGVGLAGGFLLLTFLGWDHTLLTVAVGLVSAAVLILMGYRARRDLLLITLNFLAFLTGLQAITDSWVLFKIVSLPPGMMPRNDASAMSVTVGGPANLWAILWITLDILIFGSAIYLTFIRPARSRK